MNKPYWILMFFFFSCNSNHSVSFNNAEAIAASKDTVVIKKEIAEDSLQTMDEDTNYAYSIKILDSLTFKWPTIEQTNSDAFFQKQYTGMIGSQPAVFNINLRAVNIREQKDMIIWASVYDSLYQIYFNESTLFGNLQKASESPIQICPLCQTSKPIFENRKYLTGYMGESLIALRFSKDSSQLEGYFPKEQNVGQYNYFKLNLTKPSFPLQYEVIKFHKHQKTRNEAVTEVPVTVALGVDLPTKSNKDNREFLIEQSGGLMQTLPKMSFDNLRIAAKGYHSEYLKWLNSSHVPVSRSMRGGYDNSEIIYNQQNWVIIKTETFIGDKDDSYGDMWANYICYDVLNDNFITEDDVMIKGWDNDKNMDTLMKIFNRTNPFYGFAFVCPQGVALRVGGNHGWDVEVYFIKWAKILPFLKKSFIANHQKWFTYSQYAANPSRPSSPSKKSLTLQKSVSFHLPVYTFTALTYIRHEQTDCIKCVTAYFNRYEKR